MPPFYKGICEIIHHCEMGSKSEMAGKCWPFL